jgi:formylglycine-generating enzyme required for sulfatase activity
MNAPINALLLILFGSAIGFCEMLAQAFEPFITITNSVGMKLTCLPSGVYVMGSPTSEPGRTANEVQTNETIEKGFLIGTTEVTQKQWREIMGTDPSFFKGENRPVENITWHEAVMFCQRLSDKEKKHYRLPTGVEWEYACRAGTKTAYCAGNGAEALGRVGWYQKNSGNQSHPVASKQANAWGLFDMHGNVSEWCAVREDTYKTESDLVNREIKSGRDLRGGSWGLTQGDCRSAARHRNNGDYRYFDLGFRVVCEVDAEEGK